MYALLYLVMQLVMTGSIIKRNLVSVAYHNNTRATQPTMYDQVIIYIFTLIYIIIRLCSDFNFKEIQWL